MRRPSAPQQSRYPRALWWDLLQRVGFQSGCTGASRGSKWPCLHWERTMAGSYLLIVMWHRVVLAKSSTSQSLSHAEVLASKKAWQPPLYTACIYPELTQCHSMEGSAPVSRTGCRCCHGEQAETDVKWNINCFVCLSGKTLGWSVVTGTENKKQNCADL